MKKAANLLLNALHIFWYEYFLSECIFYLSRKGMHSGNKTVNYSYQEFFYESDVKFFHLIILKTNIVINQDDNCMLPLSYNLQIENLDAF